MFTKKCAVISLLEIIESDDRRDVGRVAVKGESESNR
jgi:hypothetical protein